MDGYVIMHLHNAGEGRDSELSGHFRDVHVPRALALRGIEGVQRFRITKSS